MLFNSSNSSWAHFPDFPSTKLKIAFQVSTSNIPDCLLERLKWFLQRSLQSWAVLPICWLTFDQEVPRSATALNSIFKKQGGGKNLKLKKVRHVPAQSCIFRRNPSTLVTKWIICKFDMMVNGLQRTTGNGLGWDKLAFNNNVYAMGMLTNICPEPLMLWLMFCEYKLNHCILRHTVPL